MSRIDVDPHVCQGYANCVVTAPELLDLGDDGKVDILRAEVHGADLATAEDAVRACPVAALRLENR
ncbi:ferredoxin [Streptomyces iranensis]|uniref:Ferredoxin n=1 Tax=Streptomyces iranensis TaxID=576784 RepID=A0A060ZK22_9ACTN|nr:ferredoxin [Streptomyces iranensis]MBP2060969.1 ferredoxin [Streptomyces iranensis]CDR06440.1 ferredoxin [Streptomyces iranensis]